MRLVEAMHLQPLFILCLFASVTAIRNKRSALDNTDQKPSMSKESAAVSARIHSHNTEQEMKKVDKLMKWMTVGVKEDTCDQGAKKCENTIINAMFGARERRSIDVLKEAKAKENQKIVNKVYEVERIFNKVLKQIKSKANYSDKAEELSRAQKKIIAILTHMKWALMNKKNGLISMDDKMKSFEANNLFQRIPEKYKR